MAITPEQAAAEGFVQPTTPPAQAGMSARGQGVITPNSTAANPADASNGLAQSRIVGAQQLLEQPPLQQQVPLQQ